MRNDSQALLAARSPTSLSASVIVKAMDDKHSRIATSGPTAAAVALNLLLLERDFRIEDAPDEVRRALAVRRDRVGAALAD